MLGVHPDRRYGQPVSSIYLTPRHQGSAEAFARLEALLVASKPPRKQSAELILGAFRRRCYHSPPMVTDLLVRSILTALGGPSSHILSSILQRRRFLDRVLDALQASGWEASDENRRAVNALLASADFWAYLAEAPDSPGREISPHLETRIREIGLDTDAASKEQLAQAVQGAVVAAILDEGTAIDRMMLLRSVKTSSSDIQADFLQVREEVERLTQQLLEADSGRTKSALRQDRRLVAGVGLLLAAVGVVAGALTAQQLPDASFPASSATVVPVLVSVLASGAFAAKLLGRGSRRNEAPAHVAQRLTLQQHGVALLAHREDEPSIRRHDSTLTASDEAVADLLRALEASVNPAEHAHRRDSERHKDSDSLVPTGDGEEGDSL